MQHVFIISVFSSTDKLQQVHKQKKIETAVNTQSFLTIIDRVEEINKH